MNKLKSWIATTPYAKYALSIASADASFRKYYRLTQGEKSVIVMDSALELPSLIPFVERTKELLNAGVKVPYIFEKNMQEGYLILEDFGTTLLLNILNEKNFKRYYLAAIQEILKIQNTTTQNLPLYDKDFLHLEMDLMQEWYLEQKLKLSLNSTQKEILKQSLDSISCIVLTQPQDVFVHRDFHSRNIMLTPENEIAIIDYQDAMSGAITYDLVSLLKDCYIEYKRKDIEELALAFRDAKGVNVDNQTFLKWFDFMGLQRHIKVLGIFSRLHLRDGKDGYLKDIPLVLKYTLETASRYKETEALANLLEEVSR